MDGRESIRRQLQYEQLRTSEKLAEIGHTVCDHIVSMFEYGGLQITYRMYHRPAPSARQNRKQAITELESFANDPIQHDY